MPETLAGWDYAILVFYFGVVFVVGIWSTCRPNRGNATGYFLAGKSMHWIPIGASLYASNIGAPVLVGMSGLAAASGFAVTIYEWHAVFFLIALGWIFDPVYIACGAFTMPEYLRKRLGGKRIRMYCAIFALVGMIFFNISAELYSAAIFLEQVLNWNLYACVLAILAFTALFTVVGGLAAVIYTDTLQFVVIITGATILFILGLNEVGGWQAMEVKYMSSAANYTLANETFRECGLPRKDALHMFRDPATADIPWTGALTGLSVLGMYNFCQDQIFVQRTLSAKNMSHAKGGTLFGAYLKVTGFLLFVIPGMISRILYPDEIACADPDKCFEYCGNKAGCSNIAYPLLVLRLMPTGLRGLMLAALLAALMSSLTSILNSACSIMTMDIWRQFRKHASQKELMIVGRCAVLILVGLSILWLPVLQEAQGGKFWMYMQSIRAYLVPPMLSLFLLALFWKRLTEQGAFWGLMLSLVIGIIRAILDFTFPAPVCGSNEEDTRPVIISHIDFLHFAAILTVISAILMIAISLMTNPRPDRKLHRVTWWTKDDMEEPDLSSDDEDLEDELTAVSSDINIKEAPKSSKSRFLKYCINWVCGTGDQKLIKKRTKEEEKQLRLKMMSIAEKPNQKLILNIGAIIVSVVTVFLLGVFH